MPIKRQSNLVTSIVAALDSVCILVGFLVAVYAVLPSDGSVSFLEGARGHAAYFVLFTLVWWAAATDQNLFTFPRGDDFRKRLISLAKAVALSLVFTGFVMAFFSRRHVAREFLAVFGIAALTGIVLLRLAMRVLLLAGRRRGFNFRRIVLVGANKRARHLLEVFLTHGHFGYRVAGFIDDDPSRISYYEPYEIDYMGKCAELERLLTDEVVDEVYITLPVRSCYETVQDVAYLCEGIGVPVRLIADLFPLRIARSHITHLEDMPLLSLSTAPEAHMRLMVKRILDITASAMALLLIGWWLFPIVALLIKLESKGPVFFKQERVGQNGRRFSIYKFRSMVPDAEARKKDIQALNEADGPVFKMRKDPRITRVGSFIRKTSIDELPQFFNVFLGHMSLVGPRPPIPSEVAQYTWEQRRRLSVRPGLTGLQQVSGRSDVSFEDWVAMDLAYIDEWSLVTDFRIMLRTVRVVLLGRGAA